MRILKEPVDVLEAATLTDPYSGEANGQDWDNATRTTVQGCSVQPELGSELLVNRDMVVTRWRLRGPSGMAVTARSRVEYRGDVYEVDGDVERWPGRLAHTSLLLKRVEG